MGVGPVMDAARVRILSRGQGIVYTDRGTLTSNFGRILARSRRWSKLIGCTKYLMDKLMRHRDETISRTAWQLPFRNTRTGTSWQ